jgi:hypothetical protein
MPSDDTIDIRNWKRTREEEQQMRQFLKTETGMGNNSSYRRGYAFNFEFTDQQRAVVNKLMSDGMSFEEAFDLVKQR